MLRRKRNYLRGTGIGDTAYFGPELEHFVFNEVRYDQGTNFGYYEINAAEANWDTTKAKSPGLGPGAPEGRLLPVPPADLLQDARTEMVTTLERIGIPIEAHHHESRRAVRAKSTCVSPRLPAWPITC